jgi:hypothetical protein
MLLELTTSCCWNDLFTARSSSGVGICAFCTSKASKLSATFSRMSLRHLQSGMSIRNGRGILQSRRIMLLLCPHTAACVSAHCCICLRMLLHMCPHTAIHMSAYCCICVRILLHMYPHSATHESAPAENGLVDGPRPIARPYYYHLCCGVGVHAIP